MGEFIAINLIYVLILVVLIVLVHFVFQDHKHNKRLMDKYNVSKFPVLSKLENKYFVEILYKESRWGKFECNIYQRILKSNGGYKDKFLTGYYTDLEKYEYNYIEVAAWCVNDYEKGHIEELNKTKLRNEFLTKNKELFNQWDGVITEEKGNLK